jgi:transcriptional regulator with XRE-family HTH domain
MRPRRENAGVDDQRLGSTLRAIRQRRRWRQQDLAANARVSRSIVGRIERGALANVPYGTIRKVAQALDARVDAVVRWQGGDLGRLISARHSAMHEVMARHLRSLTGWASEPEVSFSVYGERGVIDILAWHAASRALLVIELKTDLVDLNELMATLDRKRRLAARIARERGWDPSSTSAWVVVADGRTNRRSVSDHAGVLRAKLPTDGRTIRAWLRQPAGRVNALSFLPSVPGADIGRHLAPIRRVNRPGSNGRRAARRASPSDSTVRRPQGAAP